MSPDERRIARKPRKIVRREMAAILNAPLAADAGDLAEFTHPKE